MKLPPRHNPSDPVIRPTALARYEHARTRCICLGDNLKLFYGFPGLECEARNIIAERRSWARVARVQYAILMIGSTRFDYGTRPNDSAERVAFPSSEDSWWSQLCHAYRASAPSPLPVVQQEPPGGFPGPQWDYSTYVKPPRRATRSRTREAQGGTL
jgi:hypothetical protein